MPEAPAPVETLVPPLELMVPDPPVPSLPDAVPPADPLLPQAVNADAPRRKSQIGRGTFILLVGSSRISWRSWVRGGITRSPDRAYAAHGAGTGLCRSATSREIEPDRTTSSRMIEISTPRVVRHCLTNIVEMGSRGWTDQTFLSVPTPLNENSQNSLVPVESSVFAVTCAAIIESAATYPTRIVAGCTCIRPSSFNWSFADCFSVVRRQSAACSAREQTPYVSHVRAWKCCAVHRSHTRALESSYVVLGWVVGISSFPC
jgi:hypothetical protein